VTPEQEQAFPYYRSPSAIRNEEFSHRMRGLDEDEVREYLALLADQVETSDRERSQLHDEIHRLRAELQQLRVAPPRQSEDEISPQAVLLFSQAQEVADQLVEEAVVHARDLMTSARNQQREILEQAHRAAEAAAVEAARAGGHDMVAVATSSALDYGKPVPEIEYVRTFARVAQVQLRSVLDALAEQVDKLGEVPRLGEQDRSRAADELPSLDAAREWQMDRLVPHRTDGERY
jgi:cell division initiation protein